MRRTRIFATVMLLGLFSAGTAWAEQDSCTQRSIPVSILSRDGSPLPPLSVANFKGTYRKQPVQINSFTSNTQPRRILLLLDASGSLLDPENADWQSALDIAEDLLTHMPESYEIGFAYFSTNIEREIAPTTDRKKLAAEIALLRSPRAAFPEHDTRKTALWKAIRDSARLLSPQRRGEAIFLITDGMDNASETTPRAVARVLLAAGIRLFAVVFPNPARIRATSRQRFESPDKLSDVVNETGGVQIVPPAESPFVTRELAAFNETGKKPVLRQFLNVQYQQIIALYELSIGLPELFNKLEKWNLALTGVDNSKKKNFLPVYPHTLVPCK